MMIGVSILRLFLVTVAIWFGLSIIVPLVGFLSNSVDIIEWLFRECLSRDLLELLVLFLCDHCKLLVLFLMN